MFNTLLARRLTSKTSTTPQVATKKPAEAKPRWTAAMRHCRRAEDFFTSDAFPKDFVATHLKGANIKADCRLLFHVCSSLGIGGHTSADRKGQHSQAHSCTPRIPSETQNTSPVKNGA